MTTVYCVDPSRSVVDLPAKRSKLFGHLVAQAVRVTFNEGRAIVDDQIAARLINAGLASRSPRHWTSALIRAGAHRGRSPETPGHPQCPGGLKSPPYRYGGPAR